METLANVQKPYAKFCVFCAQKQIGISAQKLVLITVFCNGSFAPSIFSSPWPLSSPGNIHIMLLKPFYFHVADKFWVLHLTPSHLLHFVLAACKSNACPCGVAAQTLSSCHHLSESEHLCLIAILLLSKILISLLRGENRNKLYNVFILKLHFLRKIVRWKHSDSVMAFCFRFAFDGISSDSSQVRNADSSPYRIFIFWRLLQHSW